ncbi:MAG TPA: GntR family transcriptional regulator [Treponemataceae bacterium]|nr:GntR family transcriptional regulator [Treponemataceae bacterium]
MISFNDRGPIYLQIVDEIKNQIVNGTLNNGEKLMSGRELAMKIKVNPNTIARSYQELERLGIAQAKRGLGTFVVEDVTLKKRLRNEMSQSIIHDFLHRMQAIGLSNTEIVDFVQKAFTLEGEK